MWAGEMYSLGTLSHNTSPVTRTSPAGWMLTRRVTLELRMEDNWVEPIGHLWQHSGQLDFIWQIRFYSVKLLGFLS